MRYNAVMKFSSFYTLFFYLLHAIYLPGFITVVMWHICNKKASCLLLCRLILVMQ